MPAYAKRKPTHKSRSRHDAPVVEGARATVRSACVAAEQRFSRSRGNPIHAWEAIFMCTHSDVAPMPLPAWCITYLHGAAQQLLAAVEREEAHATAVSKALGFTRGGWSAERAFASAARSIDAALLYGRLRYEGMPAANAYEEVRKYSHLREAYSARVLVRAGKRMLGHIPESAWTVSPTKLNAKGASSLRSFMQAVEHAKRSILAAVPNTRPRSQAKPRG
jgi:hypothetical protein